MAFNEMFRVFPNRNSLLRMLVKTMYEFGRTVAAESSAAHTYGIDAHLVKRQRVYIKKTRGMIGKLSAKPLPDRQGAAKIQLPIDLSEPYETFTTDIAGNNVPLNEATQGLQEQWMIGAAELASSNSAALPGSMTKADATRALNNIDVIEELLDELAVDIHSDGADAFIDLPTTAEPGSSFQVRGSGKALTR
ncbi:MAG: hypothetical protein GY799_26865 [Desulfobulbaceae bacterium]|nr:hypothetical protein [Desulfobulbaceae bacterium]